MSKLDQEGETYSEAETVARREAALKRAFTTPHKPHKEKRDGIVRANRKGDQV